MYHILHPHTASAFCTLHPKETGAVHCIWQDNKMVSGHSHRSVVCKGFYVSPEGKPLTACSFWHILTELTFHIVDCFLISSLKWDFCLPKTDPKLSVPPTSLLILLLHFAHCTPVDTGTVHCIWQDNKMVAGTLSSISNL